MAITDSNFGFGANNVAGTASAQIVVAVNTAFTAGQCATLEVVIQDASIAVSSFTDDTTGGPMVWTQRGTPQSVSGATPCRIEQWSTEITGTKAAGSYIGINLTGVALACATLVVKGGVAALGITNVATGTGADPSIALTTQDTNNVVVAGFATVGGTLPTAKTGTLVKALSSEGGTPVCSSINTNTAASASSVTNAITRAATPWAGMALELRSATTLPAVPNTPNPAASATGVVLGPILSWVASGATNYDVYFGTTASPPLIGNQAGATYTPGTLLASTVYFWKIVAKNGAGSTTGPIWSFTTASSGAQDRFVADTGNSTTNGTNLQTAMNAANAGDTIWLTPLARYRLPFNLPAWKGVASAITVRTTTANLPASGTQVDPAAHGPFAILESPSQPTIFAQLGVLNSGNTALVSQPAKYWTFLGVDITGPDGGYGDIVTLGYGAGDAAAHTGQYNLLQVPEFFIFDRCVVRGADPLVGQKHGIDLNCGTVEIRDCYTKDCTHASQDAQAVYGWNGPGPFTILNTHLEASGENLIFGGADPAIPGLVPANLTVKRCLFTKPIAWMNPLQNPPTAHVPTAGAGGSLTAGTKYLRLIATRITAEGNTSFSVPHAEVSATVGANGTIANVWTAAANAGGYRLYVGTAAGVYTGYIAIAPGTSYTYTGAETPVADDINGGVAAFTGSRWQVKNLLELKVMNGAVIDGNRLEYCWAHAQAGYAFLITPRNQNGTFPQCVVKNIQFTNNRIAHCGAGFQLLSADGPSHLSQVCSNIQIVNNEWFDISSTWAVTGSVAPGHWALLLSGGAHGEVAASDVTLAHNTVDHSGVALSIGSYDDRTNIGVPWQNFTLKDNLLKSNTISGSPYTINAGGLYGDGDSSINAIFPVSANRFIKKNTFAGANSATYSSIAADNFFPTLANWQAQFTNYGAQNFLLAVAPTPNLGYRTAATDGTMLGVDLTAMDTAYGVNAPASPLLPIITSAQATFTVPFENRIVVATIGGRARSVFYKDPDASKLYGVDWSPRFNPGDTIGASTWPNFPPQLAKSQESNTPSRTLVKIEGGKVGAVYLITNRRVTALSTETDDLSFQLFIEELRLGTRFKDPQAITIYSIDWTVWLNGDTIANSTWLNFPPQLTKVQESNTSTLTAVKVAGGQGGQVYPVKNRITRTTTGEIEVALFQLDCQEQ